MFKKILFIGFIIVTSFIFLSENTQAVDNSCPFDREMSLGSENSAVKELQNFLALDKNVYNGPVTGYFGSITEKAVKTFQTKAGLLANGKVDLAKATILCQVYLSYKESMPISNTEETVSDSSCFLKTLNLELGTYSQANSEVLQLQK
ncbi:MAG: peptidoglycan-binding domain-containing protein [Candidatus Paceibacterota bacterium]